MDANIGLDPSVTETFQSGTTTWFSYVGAHADNRNQSSPTFMLSTDPTTDGARGLTMQNSGNGIGGVGGPTRFNLQDIYPHYFSNGAHHQTPGGYSGGVFGGHDGIVTSFCSTPTCDGVLDESGQPRTQTMAWQISDANGFGAPNIVVGKIEWDADTQGEDIISVVGFLETDTLDEAAFDALILDLPPLSSANWAFNKPNLDQSQFDTLNLSGLKFYVDEIRIATTFAEVVGGSSFDPLFWQTATSGNWADPMWTATPGTLEDLAPTERTEMTIDQADTVVTVNSAVDPAGSVDLGASTNAELIVAETFALEVIGAVDVGADGTLTVDGGLTSGKLDSIGTVNIGAAATNAAGTGGPSLGTVTVTGGSIDSAVAIDADSLSIDAGRLTATAASVVGNATVSNSGSLDAGAGLFEADGLTVLGGGAYTGTGGLDVATVDLAGGTLNTAGGEIGAFEISGGQLTTSADLNVTTGRVTGGTFVLNANRVVVDESLRLGSVAYAITQGDLLAAHGANMLANADLTVSGGTLTVTAVGALSGNPLAYYSFDDANSVGNDDTGNGNTGTPVVPAAFDADGKFGGALLLNDNVARSGHMQIQPSGIDLDQQVVDEWTIAGWYLNLAPQGDWRTFARGFNNDHHIIVENLSDSLGAFLNGRGDFTGGGATLAPDPDVWHHLAAVGNAAGTTFYVDGAPAGSIAERAQDNVHTIGGYRTNSQRFAEKLDDVLIFGRALSPEEVAGLLVPPTSETEQLGTNLAVTADVGPTVEFRGKGAVNLGNLTIAAGVTQLTLSDATFGFADVTAVHDVSIGGDMLVRNELRPAGDLTIAGGLELDDGAAYVVELGVATNDQGQVVGPRHSRLINAGSGDFHLPAALEFDVTGVHASEIGQTATKTIVSAVAEGLMQGPFAQVPSSPGAGDPATTGHLGSGVFFRGVDYVEVVPPAPDGNSFVEANVDVYTAVGGDGNADGNVDGQDIQTLIINFSLPGDPADRNWLQNDTAGGAAGRGDGNVDGQDITDLITQFTGDAGPVEPGTAAAEYNPNTGEFTIVVDGVMNWSLTSDGLFAGSGLDALQDILPLGDAANLVSANINTVGEGLPGASPFGYAEVALGQIVEPGTDAGAFRLTFVSGFGAEPQIGSINVVPEPGTLAMLLASALGAGLIWRRLRRSH